MKYYIVVDLEWMSWKNNYYGRFLEKEKRKNWQKKEIIQIGAIKFDKNYKIKKKLNILVKPKINPKLSKYIIKLTHITQESIEKKGLNFADAFKIFCKFTKKSKIICNGNDENIFNENLILNNIKKKIKFFNIKNLLMEIYQIPNKYCSSPFLHSYFGYKINKNITHNALHDCMSIIRSLRKIRFDFDLCKFKY